LTIARDTHYAVQMRSEALYGVYVGSQGEIAND